MKGETMVKFEEKDGEVYIDGKKVLKAWESFSGWYWFGTERAYIQDSEIGGRVYRGDQIWFGLVQGMEQEWGYFSEAELMSLRGKVWEIPQEALCYSGRRH